MKLKINFTSKKQDQAFNGITIPHERDFVQNVLKSYVGLSNSLAALGAVPMPFDPYELLCYADKNGYHAAAIFIKKSMIVGKGYDGDPELLAWLDNLDTDEGLDMLFADTATDMETFGHMFIEVAQGVGRWAMYKVPAAKCRVVQTQGQGLSYLQFDYVSRTDGMFVLGQVAEFLPFKAGAAGGVRKMRLPSKSGNYWYGEPEYVATRDLLAMNVNIVDYAKKIFKQGMMSDMLLVGKGTALSAKVRRELKAYMQSQFKGLENAHKVGWLELGEGEDLDVHNLSTKIDSSFSELRHDNRDEIVSSHLVPPRLVGIISAGGIGGTGEVEGQLKIVKLSLIDPRQKLYESQWKTLFRDMGAPNWQSFRFKPLDITAGSLDMQTLAAGVKEGILSTTEAHEEWNTEKSAERNANNLITYLRKLREGLNGGK